MVADPLHAAVEDQLKVSFNDFRSEGSLFTHRAGWTANFLKGPEEGQNLKVVDPVRLS